MKEHFILWVITEIHNPIPYQVKWHCESRDKINLRATMNAETLKVGVGPSTPITDCGIKHFLWFHLYSASNLVKPVFIYFIFFFKAKIIHSYILETKHNIPHSPPPPPHWHCQSRCMWDERALSFRLSLAAITKWRLSLTPCGGLTSQNTNGPYWLCIVAMPFLF